VGPPSISNAGELAQAEVALMSAIGRSASLRLRAFEGNMSRLAAEVALADNWRRARLNQARRDLLAHSTRSAS
jgi:hypothetical protein